jgi:hypothetical protein
MGNRNVNNKSELDHANNVKQREMDKSKKAVRVESGLHYAMRGCTDYTVHDYKIHDPRSTTHHES